MSDEVVTSVSATDETPIKPLDPTLSARRPRKVNGSIWGPLEIGVAAAGLVALLGAALLYLAVVVPSNREVTRNRSEADRLDAELISARSKYGEITTTEAQVAKLLASADDFETRFLPAISNGRTSLYQRLNALIAAYGLTNTTGPDYQPLDIADQNASNNRSETERGRDRFRSLFPGVYVTATLEGSYQNLRRFIREVETGNEFIIISSVELAPSDTEQKQTPPNGQPVTAIGSPGFPAGVDPNSINIDPGPPTARSKRPQGKAHGEIVALRLEMASYFRRPNFQPLSTLGGPK